MQHITSNNAAYHDIHHQSWGIKSNFSQPFFTIWDRLLGTMWKGDVKAKYERTRAAAAGKASGGGSGSGSGKENGIGNGNGNANGGKKKAAAAANGKVKAK
jgi:sphinganine C4-monooxygenase